MHPTVGRSNRKYILGCEEFVNWAWDNRPEEFGDEIYCPCVRCINKVLRPKDVVRDHILNKGIVRSYIRWTKHGEGDEVDARHDSNNGDDMHRMLQDALGKHKQMIKDDHGRRISARNLDRIHNERFGSWFENHVQQMKRDDSIESWTRNEVEGIKVVSNTVEREQDFIDDNECDEDLSEDSDYDDDFINNSDPDY
ncbi:hypothetical protein IFM89_016439 [Coptis chinensis]|uniref:Transposase-associated domain-containing protein n=1 Tax=Coptis chinensis TaxID=261450 RepID=A0A835GZ68_9MAGN|nr:hypothetical protein IFM89_016439 [Coptis chinensis]